MQKIEKLIAVIGLGIECLVVLVAIIAPACYILFSITLTINHEMEEKAWCGSMNGDWKPDGCYRCEDGLSLYGCRMRIVKIERIKE